MTVLSNLLLRSPLRLIWALLPLFFFAACSRSVPSDAAIELAIHGVGGPVLKNLETALELPPELTTPPVDPYWLERFIRRIPKTSQEALAPFGYYQAQVAVNGPTPVNGRRRIDIVVTPGDPVEVGRLQLEVDPDAPTELQALTESFPLTPGAPLRQDLYEKAKGEWISKAVDLGYLDARFSRHTLLLDPENNLADVDLRLESGPRYRFGTLLIHGAPDYPERFLRRYLTFAAGETFSYNQLGETQRNFLDSDRFNEVLVSPQKELVRDDEVPVNIWLTPRPLFSLRPGLGYGSDTGSRLSLRYRDLNALKRGHEFSSELYVAEENQSLGLTYTLPDPLELGSATNLRGDFNREVLDSYESRAISLEVERLKGLGRGRLGTLYVRLLQEDYHVADSSDRSQMLIPGLRFSQQRQRQGSGLPTGYLYTLELRGARELVHNDTSLLQGLVSAHAVRHLTGPLSLLLRLEGGTTLLNDRVSNVPASLRFFAGGDKSVRGYAYRSLGPTDSSGEVIGCRHLLVASSELEFSFNESWGSALFFDAGNAFDLPVDFDWKKGVGVGLRRYTVVGPIMLDVARQVGERDPRYRLHLSIGFVW